MFNIHEARTRKQIDLESITNKKAKALLLKMIACKFVDYCCSSSYEVYAKEVCVDRLYDVNDDDYKLFSEDEKKTAMNLATHLATYSVDSILIYS